jgi:hypothetical protein
VRHVAPHTDAFSGGGSALSEALIASTPSRWDCGLAGSKLSMAVGTTSVLFVCVCVWGGGNVWARVVKKLAFLK